MIAAHRRVYRSTSPRLPLSQDRLPHGPGSNDRRRGHLQIHQAASSKRTVSGQALPLFGSFQILIACLLGSIVLVWSALRIVNPYLQLGRFDGAARFLFSTWMVWALVTTGAPLLWLFVVVVPEFAWGVARWWPVGRPTPQAEALLRQYIRSLGSGEPPPVGGCVQRSAQVDGGTRSHGMAPHPMRHQCAKVEEASSHHHRDMCAPRGLQTVAQFDRLSGISPYRLVQSTQHRKSATASP